MRGSKTAADNRTADGQEAATDMLFAGRNHIGDKSI